MDSQRQAIIEKLAEANNILVTVSRDPSIDQLAACIGLTLALNKLNKHATAVFSGKVPGMLDFLQPENTIEQNTDSLRDFIIALDKSKADKLRYKVEDSVVKIFITPFKSSLSDDDLNFSQGDFNVDIVIALGVHQQQDFDDAITAHGRILHDATIISINNTPSTELGTINWQELGASSLSELTASVVMGFQPPILDAQIATALLTGIVAETKQFSNDKTTPRTMNLGSELMASGANQQLVASQLETISVHTSVDNSGASGQVDVPRTSSVPSTTLEITHQPVEHSFDDQAQHSRPGDPTDMQPGPGGEARHNRRRGRRGHKSGGQSDDRAHKSPQTGDEPLPPSQNISEQNLINSAPDYSSGYMDQQHDNQRQDAGATDSQPDPITVHKPSDGDQFADTMQRSDTSDEAVVDPLQTETPVSDDTSSTLTHDFPFAGPTPPPSLPHLTELMTLPTPQSEDTAEALDVPAPAAADPLLSGGYTPSPASPPANAGDDVGSAREAVEDALRGTTPAADPPAAFNAMPMDLDLGHDGSTAQTPLLRQPDPVVIQPEPFGPAPAQPAQPQFHATQEAPTGMTNTYSVPPIFPPATTSQYEPAPLGMSPADQAFTMPLPPASAINAGISVPLPPSAGAPLSPPAVPPPVLPPSFPVQ